MDGCMKVATFFTIKTFVMYKRKCLVKPNVFVCAKVFLFYNAVKPCEICATKAKYLNQCITTEILLREFDLAILKCEDQIRVHVVRRRN